MRHPFICHCDKSLCHLGSGQSQRHATEIVHIREMRFSLKESQGRVEITSIVVSKSVQDLFEGQV